MRSNLCTIYARLFIGEVPVPIPHFKKNSTGQLYGDFTVMKKLAEMFYTGKYDQWRIKSINNGVTSGGLISIYGNTYFIYHTDYFII